MSKYSYNTSLAKGLRLPFINEAESRNLSFFSIFASKSSPTPARSSDCSGSTETPAEERCSRTCIGGVFASRFSTRRIPLGKGRVSTDRSVATALPSTAPCPSQKSSTDDSRSRHRTPPVRGVEPCYAVSHAPIVRNIPATGDTRATPPQGSGDDRH